MAITLVGETATHPSIRFSHEIAVDGDYAYFRSGPVNWADHVLIADVSDPSNPSIVGDYDGAYQWNYGFAYNYADEHCFLSSENSNAVEEIETSTKSAPTQHDSYSSGTYCDGAKGMDVWGNYLFIAARDDNMLTILDIPDSLQYEGSVADGTNLNGNYQVEVRSDGNYAFCSADIGKRVTSVNTSNKASPTVTDSITISRTCSYASLHGNYFLVSSYSNNGWHIIDVSDPSNLVERVSYAESSVCYYGTITTSNLGNVYLFIAVGSALRIYDVTDWTSPVYKESISVFGRGQTIVGDLLYVPRFSSGADRTLRIYDISDYTTQKRMTFGGVTFGGGVIQ
jgi:hypothetical protein